MIAINLFEVNIYAFEAIGSHNTGMLLIYIVH